MTDTEKLACALQALRDICDPIVYVERQIRAGEKLSDGLRIDFIESPLTYRGIARRALKAMGEWEGKG